MSIRGCSVIDVRCANNLIDLSLKVVDSAKMLIARQGMAIRRPLC